MEFSELTESVNISEMRDFTKDNNVIEKEIEIIRLKKEIEKLNSIIKENYEDSTRKNKIRELMIYYINNLENESIIKMKKKIQFDINFLTKELVNNQNSIYSPLLGDLKEIFNQMKISNKRNLKDEVDSLIKEKKIYSTKSETFDRKKNDFYESILKENIKIKKRLFMNLDKNLSEVKSKNDLVIKRSKSNLIIQNIKHCYSYTNEKKIRDKDRVEEVGNVKNNDLKNITNQNVKKKGRNKEKKLEMYKNIENRKKNLISSKADIIEKIIKKEVDVFNSSTYKEDQIKGGNNKHFEFQNKFINLNVFKENALKQNMLEKNEIEKKFLKSKDFFTKAIINFKSNNLNEKENENLNFQFIHMEQKLNSIKKNINEKKRKDKSNSLHRNYYAFGSSTKNQESPLSIKNNFTLIQKKIDLNSNLIKIHENQNSERNLCFKKVNKKHIEEIEIRNDKVNIHGKYQSNDYYDKFSNSQVKIKENFESNFNNKYYCDPNHLRENESIYTFYNKDVEVKKPSQLEQKIRKISSLKNYSKKSFKEEKEKIKKIKIDSKERPKKLNFSPKLFSNYTRTLNKSIINYKLKPNDSNRSNFNSILNKNTFIFKTFDKKIQKSNSIKKKIMKKNEIEKLKFKTQYSNNKNLYNGDVCEENNKMFKTFTQSSQQKKNTKKRKLKISNK